jgi:glycosyltransferase involved in cell wall biosynthesis
MDNTPAGSAPRLSVIVPAHNAAQTIDICLDALQRQSLPRTAYEVLVVDDGSTDTTASRVAACPDVRLILQPHTGAAAARNLGAAHARGQILLFTDADCVPKPDWIVRMVAPFQDPEIVGAKGAYTPLPGPLVYRFVQLEYEDKYAHMARARHIDFIDTYAAAYRRDVFLANGGFDRNFPVDEDQEFSFRLAEQGYKMVFAPSAQVGHLGHAASVNAYARKKYKIGFWKVFVHIQHPDKLLHDSHTPQVLKLQILLAGGMSLCLPGSLRWRFARQLMALLAALFVVTTLPFAEKAWARDRAVALAAPALLLVRALALGLGFAAGLGAGLRRHIH